MRKTTVGCVLLVAAAPVVGAWRSWSDLLIKGITTGVFIVWTLVLIFQVFWYRMERPGEVRDLKRALYKAERRSADGGSGALRVMWLRLKLWVARDRRRHD